MRVRNGGVPPPPLYGVVWFGFVWGVVLLFRGFFGFVLGVVCY